MESKTALETSVTAPRVVDLVWWSQRDGGTASSWRRLRRSSGSPSVRGIRYIWSRPSLSGLLNGTAARRTADHHDAGAIDHAHRRYCDNAV